MTWRLGELLTSLRRRPAVRTGLARARDAVGPVAWVSLAAGVSYWLAQVLLGHPYPFFAAVTAFSALGFSPDVRPRRVGELALGVTLGVGIGEAIQLGLGSGPLQTAVVVFVAAMIGRVVDPSPVLTTQSAVQAIVVLGLPAMASTGGPVGRWSDALLGGAVALLFSLFLPKDPRRRPRRLAVRTLGELAQVLGAVAAALREQRTDPALQALNRARRTQGLLVEWGEAVDAAVSTARLSPAWRRHSPELDRLTQMCEYTDRAIRTTRVLARRVGTVQQGAGGVGIGVTVARLAELCEQIAAATVAPAEQREHLAEDVRRDLIDLAAGLRTHGEQDPDRYTLVSLLRSVVFDLLRVGGCTDTQARAALR